ncbi:TRAP transporter small permease [Thorsellia anophelis]|uniref:TRAP transporter small permease protein n=1 Tax=Thorsellia anophelis DSM 18579 TaxID=1123402 RepID=A0A1I0B807_9GAMM|nr:TRAP transporter small permease [Thorsellia anophelis]SET02539.1 TRAP-type C4-dicarboxylate transport system, small permease component [Thorsellia anophelis DSM 18579]
MNHVLNKFWASIHFVIFSLMFFMMVIVFANVVMRYGLSSGIRVSAELSRLGLVWVVMLGTAIVVKQETHLAVTEFSERFFPKLVPILKRLNYLIILGLMMLFMIGTYNQTLANWGDISQLTGLPSGLFYLSGFISSILIGLIALVRVINPAFMLDNAEEQ